MTDNPTERSAARTREHTISLNRLGREWLQSFFSAVRTIQIHEPNNRIFDEPIASLIRASEEMLSLEGRMDFLIVQDQFFLNGLWIKPTILERENLFSLADALKTVGLGGISVRSTTIDPQWRVFLKVYRETTPSVPENRASEMNEALAGAGIEHLALLKVIDIHDRPEIDLPLPPLTYAAVTGYAKALLSLREFARCGPGEEQVAALRKIQRIVCELVDLADRAPRLFCALTLLRDFDSYFYHHGANVMINSILLGREVGIGRKDLVTLGMAALVHDIGKLLLPEELLDKPTELSREEWSQIRRHPIESAKIFLCLGYMNHSVAERALVAYQHHMAHRSADTYPQPRREVKVSLMSDIVAVCVRFDSMISHKNYRPGLTPWEAIRIIDGEARAGHFRTDVANAFIQFLGPLPTGSWIRIGSDQEGVVAASGTLAPHPPYPLLFLKSKDGTTHWIDAKELSSATEPSKLVTGKPGSSQYHACISAMFKSSLDSILLT